MINFGIDTIVNYIEKKIQYGRRMCKHNNTNIVSLNMSFTVLNVDCKNGHRNKIQNLIFDCTIHL